VFQFAVTVVLLAGTAVVYRQVGYMLGKGLGFEAEAVVVVEGTEVLRGQTEVFRQALLARPDVVHAAHAESMPGRALGTSMVRPEGADEAAQVPMAWMFSGFDLAETLALEVTAGRSLSAGFAGDSTGALLNEAAVRAMGLEGPVGRRIVWRNARTYTVVGVVKDFHYASLHEAIGPQVIFGPDPFFDNRPRQVFAVRVRTDNLAGTLAGLEATWKDFIPEQPFAYTFLDADLDRLYRAEQRIGSLFAGFTALALLIACLGLFGLAAFTAERRTKEIGVRKVLGASALQVVLLLSKDFIRLVVLAFVLAAPLAYFGAARWLQNFAYRVDPGWMLFAAVGVVVLTIALLTVSYQAYRAATADPVRTLRYE
jgi:putative ABC transport system permease protein